MHIITKLMINSNKTLRYLIDECLREFNLTGIQFFVLKKVEDERVITVSSLATFFNSDRPTISAVFTRLHEKGYVTKVTNDDDKRSFYITLTDEGKELIGKAFVMVEKTRNDFFNVLTKQEQEQLISLLEKLPRRETNE